MALTRQKLFKLLFCLSICWNLGFLITNHIAEKKLKGIRDFTTEYCKHFNSQNAERSQGVIEVIPKDSGNLPALPEVVNINGTSSLKPCPVQGNALVGRLKVNVKELHEEAKSVEMLSVTKFGAVEIGGWWRPRTCKPRTNVAIMVPLRDREAQLKTFLWHIHPILQRQLLSYRIIVVEQTGNTTFNKGAIYNIAFNETLTWEDFDCYIFHDVDLLAENDLNLYDCNSAPKHMSVAVDTLRYRLPHLGIFGGVEVLTKRQFIHVNGFSNMYWGWGGEDDDLYTRITEKGYHLARPHTDLSRYKMNKISHIRKDGVNKQNVKMYYDFSSRKKRIDVDGLRQINTLKFDKKVKKELLVTRIAINLHR